MLDYNERLKNENLTLRKRITFLLKGEAARRRSSERCIQEVIEKTKSLSKKEIIEHVNMELNRQLILLERITNWKKNKNER